MRLDPQYRRVDPAQLDRCPGNCTREPHAAYRAGKELLVFAARAQQHLSGRSDQLQSLHETPKSPDPVMILAVDVIGDRAAQGEKSGARHDRKHISESGHALLKDVQTHTALGGHGIRLRIDVQNSIAQSGPKVVAVRAQYFVAVAAQIA